VLVEQGYEHVLPPLAELRRDDTDLAVLREFLVGATEGWQLARASVRDLLASRLPPEECGADFAPDSARLGDVIAGLHLAMTAAWGSEAGDPARWVDQMLVAADALAGQPGTDGLDLGAVRALLDEARALEDAGREIRVHGDLHLAQVIQVDTGWLVLDFEGEPTRRRDDRFTSSSPLRDVAGMLRSLHYAAATGLAEWDQGDAELLGLLDAWEERNREAFVHAYLAVDGIDALLPVDPTARDALLAAFELDKAIYELGYELGHRPELANIPRAGIERLVRGPVPT
jgi:maltokinase